jgi:DNA-binding NarL/FixJ family response regulator
MSLDSDDGTESMVRAVMMIILGIVIIGGAADLYFDAPDRLDLHVGVELFLMVVSVGTAVYLWREWRRTSDALGTARESLVSSRAESDEWRRRSDAALSGLRQAIDDQFVKWQLTPTEREIAVLLLQGLGHKQIAGRTKRSERTVRQHAVTIYHKSGLQGRAELAAFFLEGLVSTR